MHDYDIDEINEHITYEWDGPVDNYVAIVRALRFARNRPDVSVGLITQSLLEVLDLPANKVIIRET